MPREKAVPETDATSCRRTAGSSRYPFVVVCSGSFQKYGKICRAEGKPGEWTKEWEGGDSKNVLRQCLSRVGYRRSRGKSVHKEGSPECPSFLLYSLSFSRSLLQHRQTWSNRFLRPFFVARIHHAAFCCRCQCTGTLHARGEVFAFRKIQRILLLWPRTRISALESQFCEKVSKELIYVCVYIYMFFICCKHHIPVFINIKHKLAETRSFSNFKFVFAFRNFLFSFREKRS